MDNVLVMWAKRGTVERAENIIKAKIERVYSIESGEFVKTESGFKFLFNAETSGDASFSFEVGPGDELTITLCATWSWEAIQLYELTNSCLDEIENYMEN